ncbi:MAG: glutathione binding-like protein, partial [Tepidimonas fonticaldi]|nr:glutathione binding-like protein [Tepidimonas fonticaldi]
HDHLAAARFTIADLCVACVANWARPSQELMHAFPRVHDWLQRCHARPAYQALKAAAKGQG